MFPPDSTIIDLTLPLRDGQRGVAIETKYMLERDGWNASTLHLYSHAGTHLDAPIHFGCGTKTVDAIPLDQCIGTAHVVDVSTVPPCGEIQVDNLGDVASTFQPGNSLLLASGWSAHVDDPDYYRSSFPRVSEGLAQWCAENGVKALGVEPPSVADVHHLEEVTKIHQILLGADILIVEGLTGLREIGGRTVFFAALPLKVTGGDGCPCRAFALLPPHKEEAP